MKYLLFILVSLLFACDYRAKIDFNKIKKYSFDLENEWFVAPPYIAEFTQRNKKLWYLGVTHSNSSNSETFNLIDKFLSEYKPDIIIIEGVENNYGISPSTILESAKYECAESNITKAKSACGENLYIAYKADKSSIPFIGGEPSDKQLLNFFQDNGFNSIDYVNYWFTSMVPQFYREGKINSYHDIENQYYKFLKILDVKSMNYVQYKIWLSENIPSANFNELIDGNFSAPISDGNYLQRLSALIESVRDRHILKTIFKLLRKYEKILVVYGHSHFLIQQDVIIDALGKFSILNN